MRCIIGAFGNKDILNLGWFLGMLDRVKAEGLVGQYRRYAMTPYCTVLGVFETKLKGRQPPTAEAGVVAAGSFTNAESLGLRGGERPLDLLSRFMGRTTIDDVALSCRLIETTPVEGVALVVVGNEPENPRTFLVRTSSDPSMFFWRHAPSGSIYFASRNEHIQPCVSWGTAPVELQPDHVLDLRTGGVATITGV